MMIIALCCFFLQNGGERDMIGGALLSSSDSLPLSSQEWVGMGAKYSNGEWARLKRQVLTTEH